MTTTEEFRQQGNEFFKAKKYGRAVASYSKAIKDQPENHLLYANRSIALLRIGKPIRALRDADKCVELQPDWIKGYYRRASVLLELRRLPEARDALLEALDKAPNSKDLENLLEKVMTELGIGHGSETPSTPLKLGKDNGEYTSEPSEGNVKRFGDEMLRNVQACVRGRMKIDGHAMVLQPKEDAMLGQVRMQQAFLSPDTLREAGGFLRDYVKKHQGHAVFMVIPKHIVGYPAVWNSSLWKQGKKGVFCQLESPETRRVWFVNMSGSGDIKDTVELDTDSFAIMPPLFVEDDN
eukprot:gb/GECH01004385.1/.p1 GENE.gb/GECH01004385.1/~~gb/GECH01004385.1/.p1  ORF type:complete len:294 (+),score=86.88 gb/GECH01004385.1/:1-882(+)